MAKENETEGADLSQENGGSDESADNSQDESQNDNGQQDTGEESDDQQEGQSQDDYRGKLNATNRFLEKEGYVFKDGRWQKPAQSSRQQTQQQQQQRQQAAPALSREEGILFARGFTEAQVEYAKKVATLQNVKLTEAVDDPLFTTWKAAEDKKAKDAAAQLPASRGGKSVTKKTFGTKGLSDEDHKALFNEKIGR